MEQPKDYIDKDYDPIADSIPEAMGELIDKPEFDITNFRYAILLSVVLWVIIISLIAWWL